MQIQKLLANCSTNIKLIALSATILTISGCSWVEVNPNASQVKLLTISDIQNCEKLGEIESTVLDKVGFIDRDKEAVVENLVDLARNEAVQMGGNALVPASKVKDGRMRFWLYQCPGKKP